MDSDYETLLFPAEVEKYGHMGGRPELGLWLRARHAAPGWLDRAGAR